MRHHLAKGAKIAIFFSVGIIMLYLVYKRQDIAFQADCALKGTPSDQCSLLGKIIQDISNAKYIWILLSLGLFMITNVFRALRWKMMLNAIGYQPKFINLLGTIMINYLANLGIPRSGEVIRAGLISQYDNIPVEKALGTIFTDRIFDVLMLALAIGLAILLGGSDFIAYLDENINLGERFNILLGKPWLMTFIGVIIISCCILFWKNRVKVGATSMGQKIIHLFEGFADGVQSVRQVSSLPLFIFYTIGIWFLYYMMTYVAFFSFEPTSHLGPIAGLVVFVFGSLGIVIPTPGGMGSYHYLIGESLAMYGIGGIEAFSFANIIFFSIQVFINIFLGIIAIVLLPIINKDKI